MVETSLSRFVIFACFSKRWLRGILQYRRNTWSVA